jgi:hypothetical protein
VPIGLSQMLPHQARQGIMGRFKGCVQAFGSIWRLNCCRLLSNLPKSIMLVGVLTVWTAEAMRNSC